MTHWFKFRLAAHKLAPADISTHAPSLFSRNSSIARATFLNHFCASWEAIQSYERPKAGGTIRRLLQRA
jgi:hypothetical protein